MEIVSTISVASDRLIAGPQSLVGWDDYLGRRTPSLNVATLLQPIDCPRERDGVIRCEQSPFGPPAPLPDPQPYLVELLGDGPGQFGVAISPGYPIHWHAYGDAQHRVPGSLVVSVGVGLDRQQRQYEQLLVGEVAREGVGRADVYHGSSFAAAVFNLGYHREAQRQAVRDSI